MAMCSGALSETLLCTALVFVLAHRDTLSTADKGVRGFWGGVVVVVGGRNGEGVSHSVTL